MPIITDIKRQKRTDSRVNVYLDGTYSFALSDLDLSTSGLRVGQVLSAVEVQEFREQAAADGVYAKALRYLAVRPRSRREMRDYLARKDVSDEQTAPVLERLERAGLINDEAFAVGWIAGRQAVRPRSRRRLEQELMAKGVSRDEIAVALEEGLEPDAELAALVSVAEKKQRLLQYREPEKLMGYLARQGYSYELIKKALEVLAERSSGQS